MDQLDALLEMARVPETLETRRESISKWSVGEQMQHVTLVDGGILRMLEKASLPVPGGASNSSGDMADKGPTMIGRCMLLLGFIPRGRGKAPSFVMPSETRYDQVEPSLAAVRQRFADLDLVPLTRAGALARHHVFGHLNGTCWLRFVDIHHHHHWKIIRDMLRAA